MKASRAAGGPRGLPVPGMPGTGARHAL